MVSQDNDSSQKDKKVQVMFVREDLIKDSFLIFDRLNKLNEKNVKLIVIAAIQVGDRSEKNKGEDI